MMPDDGQEPIFALMPAPGDVDIVVAAEIMEAGRAITRGLVTADRTTLIASQHRMFAVSEKIVPGDGRADVEIVLNAARDSSKDFICFPMDRIAVATGSHISACLLGALAGSGALPFPKEHYVETIEAAGRGVSASIKAFDMAYGQAKSETIEFAERNGDVDVAPVGVQGPKPLIARWQSLMERIGALPEPVRDMARRGAEKLVDFQDIDYADTYLGQVERSVGLDRFDQGYGFTVQLAKYLANAMAYDDVIRVADLKTRGSRFDRVRQDLGVDPGSLVQITEFMHPRAAEFCGVLPRRLGQAIEARPRLFALLDRLINRGRRVRTDAVLPFLGLYVVAGLRRWRRGSLRHHQEKAHWEAWLHRAFNCLEQDYALGVEILRCRRLIKGYSDTHSRGLSKYDRVLAGVDLVAGRHDAADWVRRLREAALADEKGHALDGALQTIRSFADTEAGNGAVENRAS